MPKSLVDISRESDSKSAFEDLTGGSSGDTLVVTPSTDLDDYDPVGLSTAARLALNPSTSIVFSGLAGGSDGRTITISNRSTDYLVVLENQGTGSVAANRFDLPNGFPLFLMPGDRATFTYSTTSSRWQLVSASSNVSQMGLTEFSDFGAVAAPAANGAAGPFGAFASGTGASLQPSAYLVNTTEKPMGVIQADTGTTATGRAGLGSTGTDQIVPGLGCVLAVSRVAVEALPTAAETFAAHAGFIDVGAAGATVDGAWWRMFWTGSVAQWQRARASNSVVTVDASAVTADANYIWLAVFVNAAGTRADYFYSTDSINWTKDGTATTGLPAAGRNFAFCAGAIVKSVGTTQRNLSIDLAGYRADYVRG